MPVFAHREQGKGSSSGGGQLHKAAVVGVVLVVGAVILAVVGVLFPRPVGDSTALPAQGTEEQAVGQVDEWPIAVIPAGPLPTVFSFCADVEVGPASYARSPLGVRASWEVARGLPDVASQVLQTYEEQSNVDLHYGGYLDFLGNVWACAVSCPSWVEVVIVQDQGGEEAYVGSHSQNGPCLVSVMRLGQEAIEDAGGQA